MGPWDSAATSIARTIRASAITAHSLVAANTLTGAVIAAGREISTPANIVKKFATTTATTTANIKITTITAEATITTTADTETDTATIKAITTTAMVTDTAATDRMSISAP